MKSLTGAPPPPPQHTQIGDFGDQNYPLSISKRKTDLDLNTCPGGKICDFGDYSDRIYNTNEIVTRPPPPKNR